MDKKAEGGKAQGGKRDKKIPNMDGIAEAIARRRFECGLDLLTERERSEVYDEAFDGLCETERHNC